MEESVNDGMLRLLGNLLHYPYESMKSAIDHALSCSNERFPEIALEVEKFSQGSKKLPQEKLEELYVNTFDVQAVCCLDVGYLLFGEEYKRGQFMAEVHKLHRENGVDCGTDLPDYLPNLLNLIQVLDKAEASLLVKTFIYPAVMKMEECFTNEENFYKFLLVAIKKALHEIYEIKVSEVTVYLPVVDKEEICSQM